MANTFGVNVPSISKTTAWLPDCFGSGTGEYGSCAQELHNIAVMTVMNLYTISPELRTVIAMMSASLRFWLVLLTEVVETYKLPAVSLTTLEGTRWVVLLTVGTPPSIHVGWTRSSSSAKWARTATKPAFLAIFGVTLAHYFPQL